MYQCKKDVFGEWERFIIRNEETGNGFSLVPEMGACLIDLHFEHQNILDGFENPQALKLGDWTKSGLLFPFPNRLNDGAYQLAGKSYQFPINDGDGLHAIHGLGLQKNFELRKVQVQEDFAKVFCRYQDAGNDPAYPFPFSIEINFSIHHKTGFEVEFLMTNQANHSIPAGLGWHPYFALGEAIDEYTMQIPDCQLIEVNEKMIPTGVKKEYTNFKDKKRIGQTVLDTCFELKNKTDRASIFIETKKTELHYWQETGNHSWNFFQIFTPQHRNSIAIEPMSCNIDAFNQDGLVLLEAQQQLGGKFGVQFIKK